MNGPAVSSGRLARDSAVMAMGIALSRISGLLRIAAVAAAIGVAESRLADAYNLANAAPNIIYELVLGGILASIVVPVMVELLEDDPDRAWDVASGLLNVAILLLTGITLIGVLAAPTLAGFYASRLGGSEAVVQREVTTFLLRLLLPQIVFYGLTGITSGLLNAHRRFAAPTFTPVLNNVAVILIFVAFHQTYERVGVDASDQQLTIIGLGTTVGVVVMTVAQLPFLRGLGRYRLTLSVPSSVLRKVLHLSGFIFAYVLVSQLGYLFMQWLANGEQGGYSAFVAGYMFFLVPVSLVGYSVTTALLPDLSAHALGARWSDFRERLSAGVRLTLFLLIPATVGYLVLGRTLIELLLLNGVVTAESVSLVWEVLAFLVLGLPQTAIFSIFVRTFYAMQDAKTPFYIVTGIVVLNAAINIPLFSWFGVGGLALGQSIVYSVAIFLVGRALSARVGGIDAHGAVRCIARALPAALAMGAILWIVVQVLEDWFRTTALTPGLIVLMFLAAVGMATYLSFSRLFGADEGDYVFSLFRTRSAKDRRLDDESTQFENER
jgi:putative peptidoglycan lipid II flippase